VGPTWAEFVRFGSGTRVARRLGRRPLEPLELYEFETCPFCRKVREAIQVLDLEVCVRPCPKGGERHRPQVEALGGRSQFPYLVDHDAGIALYESDDIVRHLFERYGCGRPRWPLGAGVIDTLLSTCAGLAHPSDGTFASASNPPERPLELSADEGSAASRKVRARLCSLELAYMSRPAARGSERAAALARRGAVLPVLFDPNAGVTVEGAAAALAHLERYRAPARD
jgi:glutathione S-transferase